MIGMHRAVLAVAGTLLAWAASPVPMSPMSLSYAQLPSWPAHAPARTHASVPGDSATRTHHRPSREGMAAAVRAAGAVRAADAAGEVVAAVNRHRARAGCRPLRLRASLNRAAWAHSADMARSRHLGHTGTNGSSPASRMRAAGYHPRHIAENIAAGVRTPQAAVRTWMHSASHRVLILTCRYTHAGVGVARGHGGLWWTLDLATGR